MAEPEVGGAMTRMQSIAALALGISATALPARAEDVPSWFVGQDKCMSRPCTCDDMPMLEAYIANQKNGRDAWMMVKSDIFSSTGPTSGAAAIKQFQSRFAGDPRITDQFKMCTSYDPAKNSVTKVAGVSPLGTASLDPCFCETFCQDIIDATVAHERMHVPTLLLGLLNYGDVMIACKLGIGLPASLCNGIEPTILAESELPSYDKGIASLEAAANRIPSESSVQCTWQPLPPVAPPPMAAAIPSPPGLLARLKLIFARILRGAAPSESFAVLDVRAR
jgi:hypothetical protein